MRLWQKCGTKCVLKSGLEKNHLSTSLNISEYVAELVL